MRSVAHDLKITFASKVFVLVMAAVIQVCLARGLGSEGRGAYAICFMIASMVQLFFSLSADVAFAHFVASGRIKPSAAPGYLLVYAGIGALLGVVAMCVLIALRPAFLNYIDNTSLYLMVALAPLLMFSLALLRILTAVHDFTFHAACWCVKYLIELGLLLLAVFGFSLGVRGALLAKIASELAIVATVTLYIHKKYALQRTLPSLAVLKELAAYGIRYYPGKLGNGVNLRMGTLVAAMFLGRAEIGMFAVASALMLRIQILPETLMTVLLPKVSSRQCDSDRLIAQCAKLTAIVMLFVVGALFLWSETIVVVLFSTEFLPVASLMRIMALGTLAISFGKVFVPYLIGNDRPGSVSVGVVAGITLNVIAAILLGRVLGMSGIAWAMSMGYMLTATVYTAYFCAMSGLGPIRMWFTIREDFTMAFRMAFGFMRKPS